MEGSASPDRGRGGSLSEVGFGFDDKEEEEDGGDVEEEEDDDEELLLLEDDDELVVVVVVVVVVVLLVQLVGCPVLFSRRRPGRLAKMYWHSMPLAWHFEQEGFSFGHLILEVAQDWQLSRTLVQPSALRRTTGARGEDAVSLAVSRVAMFDGGQVEGVLLMADLFLNFASCLRLQRRGGSSVVQTWNREKGRGGQSN